MGELRWFALLASLIVAAGVALHQAVGEVVDPFTVLAVLLLARVCWRAYRLRRARIHRTVLQIRAHSAADRARLVDEIEVPEFRAAVSAALGEEGTERRDGASEIFPLPAGMRRRLTAKYWRIAAAGAAAVIVAALLPSTAAIWRGGAILTAVALLLRLRRLGRLYPALDALIEVNPYRMTYVRSDGLRLTVAFADGVVCEHSSENQLLIVRSGSTRIPVSYHTVGFNRLADLLEQYGATDAPPADD